MSARKKPVLPETVSMADDVPNPYGYAIMGILQAKLLEARAQLPSVRLKTMFVCESEDTRAHTQFFFVDLERIGAAVPYVSMNEYCEADGRYFDLWLHNGETGELFVQADANELVVAANTIWCHLLPHERTK